MYSFKSKQKFSSKRYPGIEAVIRPLTVERRSELDMAISVQPKRQEYYEALLDRQDIKGDSRPEQLERAALNERIMSLERVQRIGPYMRVCVESVSGFETDAGPATPETLATVAPHDLAEEIVEFIDFDSRLSSVQEKNSSPSSDSSAPVPPEISNTIAGNANNSAGIERETALSTSPSSP